MDHNIPSLEHTVGEFWEFLLWCILSISPALHPTDEFTNLQDYKWTASTCDALLRRHTRKILASRCWETSPGVRLLRTSRGRDKRTHRWQSLFLILGLWLDHQSLRVFLTSTIKIVLTFKSGWLYQQEWGKKNNNNNNKKLLGIQIHIR